MKNERISDTTSIKKNNNVINSLILGSLSSTVTTILYQPLELIKTNVQIQNSFIGEKENKIIRLGSTSRSAKNLINKHGLHYLWRGTGASLLRSVPGVGLYYSSLSLLQNNFSQNNLHPDNASQAFYFGLIARSMVSFILSPVSLVKVRYESGRYQYSNLPLAIKDAYFKNGWVGVTPTILRDSLFSGIYYMCYTKSKQYYNDSEEGYKKPIERRCLINFVSGLASGLIASLVTNPLDVLKTNMQVRNNASIKSTTSVIMGKKNGHMRFFDGLAPRCLRRTLIAASTWTFYEFFIDSFR